MDPILTEANQRVDNALVHLQRELANIRAGRANPSLIEDIPVMAYGARMKLVEVGTISAPQPSLLTVHVWDPGVVKDVEKAILEANLGLNPAVDGQTVRLPIPPLTEERREEFVKLAHQKGETAKIEMRQIRADLRKDWELKKAEIGEDEVNRRERILQELIDESVAAVDEYVKAKEGELRQI
ncbi:ribosome recycling factor [Candidatus Daviesbacteria bacterium]|nr:ribosome recycling factor [Candidatus Daviesbacteria bacterium]